MDEHHRAVGSNPTSSAKPLRRSITQPDWKILLMDTQPRPETIKIQEISFPNGNRALAVIPPIHLPATYLVQVLDIPLPEFLIMIVDGAARMDERDQTNLMRLFSDGIAHIAVTHHALVIDGGTKSGAMELMGQGIAQQPLRPVLLGISPAENVTYPGSGRFADELAKMLHNESSLDSDTDLTEIIKQGKLYLFSIAGSTLEFEELIQRLFDEQQ